MKKNELTSESVSWQAHEYRKGRWKETRTSPAGTVFVVYVTTCRRVFPSFAGDARRCNRFRVTEYVVSMSIETKSRLLLSELKALMIDEVQGVSDYLNALRFNELSWGMLVGATGFTC